MGALDGRSPLRRVRGRLGPVKWTNERPARRPGPASVSWSGPINWGKFVPKRARKDNCGGRPRWRHVVGRH